MAIWYCVKCGRGGKGALSALSGAAACRSQWRKFLALIVCPACGDDRGHAGILELGPDERLADLGVRPIPDGQRPSARWDPRLPTSRDEALRLAFWLRRWMDRWPEGAEETRRALIQHRGFPEELADRMVRRGVRLVRPARLAWLIRHAPLELEVAVVPLLRNRPGFLLPVCWFLPRDGLGLAAVQVRYVGGGDPRYRTGRLFRRWTPPAAWLEPGGKPVLSGEPAPPWPFRDGSGAPRIPGPVLITEGWFKAAVAAELLEAPAVGFLGVPRQSLAIARRLRRLGVRQVWLAPDRDDPPRPAVQEAFQELARVLREARLEVRFLEWPDGKGIDDALLAGWRPVAFYRAVFSAR